MKLHPMVTFSGNCRQALAFYRSCFGGELTFESLPENMKARLPCRFKDIVLRGKLACEHFTIYGSDLGETTARGRISLIVDAVNGEDIRLVFDRLSEGGEVLSDPGDVRTGSVIDRFGVEWQLVDTSQAGSGK